MVVSGVGPVVVVGVDGSRNAEVALQWAEQYAQTTGGGLKVVVAWEWPLSYGYPMSFEGFDPKADAVEVAEKAIAGLTLPPERIELEAREGSPGDVLVRASADADLLVVGVSGNRLVASFLIGSVSSHCVHHAQVPVVVVPTDRS
jgi:nucleotide-binding universal stress UspA family protein